MTVKIKETLTAERKKHFGEKSVDLRSIIGKELIIESLELENHMGSALARLSGTTVPIPTSRYGTETVEVNISEYLIPVAALEIIGIKKEYLTIEKVKALQESIGFLDSYKTPEDETVHHIGPNINTEDVAETKLLRELGEINKRRQTIIETIMNK